MKDKFNHIERRGLPGGPNEQFTYVTGVFSTDGYRYDSPDVNNIYNVIPSGNISMREKNGEPLKKGPILGIDNLGNRQLMQPGFDYQFPGDQVFELPMAQKGKYIPPNFSDFNYGNVASESTSRTYNAKGTTKPTSTATPSVSKQQVAKSVQEAQQLRKIQEDERRARIADSEAAKKIPYTLQNFPEVIARETQAIGDKLQSDYIPDILNPAMMLGELASGIGRVPLNLQQGNYGEAALNIGLPLVTGAFAGLGAKTTGQFVNNLVNPVAGIGDTPKQLPGSGNVDDVGKLNFSNKLGETKDQLSKAIKGTTSTLNEIKGELLQGKVNRESIKKGNEWLEKWINHPATKEKINTTIDDKIDFVAKFYNTPFDEIDLLNLIRTQSRDFKPNTKEYSLLKQLDDNLQQYLSKKSRESIHQGNWGVSYQHSKSPQYRKAVEEGLEQPFDKYGSWISRTTKLPQDKRISTTIHEGTHDWVSEEAFKKLGMRNTALKNMNPKIKDDFLEWEKYNNFGFDPVEKMGRKRAYQAYLADPTEQHARIMELRYDLGITPNYKMDLEDAEKVLKWIDEGGSKIDPKFLNVIDKDPKKLADLFNRFWMAPAATIGAGALQEKSEYKTGGNINQPKYQTGNEIAFDIYKKYINGEYMNTDKENWAKQTYDRLNRIYYKDAKNAGMSVPNYIMTNVLTLQ